MRRVWLDGETGRRQTCKLHHIFRPPDQLGDPQTQLSAGHTPQVLTNDKHFLQADVVTFPPKLTLRLEVNVPMVDNGPPLLA